MSDNAGPYPWHDLQQALRDCKSEKDVQAIFDAEVSGPNRMRWLTRIQGRLRTLRKEREDLELRNLHRDTRREAQ